MNVFGNIPVPTPLARFGSIQGGAIGILLNIAVQTLIAVASIYALFNFIFAGYAFLSAGDDPKKVQAAWAKIWQTALGLTVVAGSFVLAALFGRLIFGDYDALLTPVIPTI